MSAQHREPGIQSPEFVASLLVLGLLEGREAEAVPLSAAWWMVEGYENVELAKLAALSGQDTYEVRDVLPAALDAMGITLPASDLAYSAVFRELARRCLDGRISERSLVSEGARIYISSGYSDEVDRQPLGVAYGLDDEWDGGWGRTAEELVEAVRSACREQLSKGDT